MSAAVLTADLLEQIGRALHGERWQTGLAADLERTDRTMRRWMSGESVIPAGVVADLRHLLELRAGAIDRLLSELPAAREAAE